MSALTNSRQEIFTQNWFAGKTKEESAIIAGYQGNWARSIGSRLSTNVNVLARYNELQQKAEDASVATVLQRRQVASKITLATIGDFVDEYGNLDITDKSKLDTPAVQEIKTERTLAGIRTTIKLRDPLAGADLLNRMDKLYEEKPPSVNTNLIFIIGKGYQERLSLPGKGEE